MDIFSIFFHMKVCCVFSLESPHQGDSSEYKQHAIIDSEKKITLNYPKYNNVCSYGIFSYGLRNEFEKAMVKEPLVFQPLKFYCILRSKRKHALFACPYFMYLLLLRSEILHDLRYTNVVYIIKLLTETLD